LSDQATLDISKADGGSRVLLDRLDVYEVIVIEHQ